MNIIIILYILTISNVISCKLSSEEVSSDSSFSNSYSDESYPTELWDTIQLKFIEQPLDHFNASDERTWYMRYLQRIDLWKPNGPIYLYSSGESDISERYLFEGMINELATETNGVIYGLEHRYYGTSIPLCEDTTENLKYLNSKQALADIAMFIKTVKLFPKFNNSKVVIIGSSYAGNLAAWMKQLYPDLVDAAIASSAPVKAKTIFNEYYEQVSTNYRKYGTKKCIKAINRIFNKYESMLASESGIETLKEKENICNYCDISKPLNQQCFFEDILREFAENSQYGDPEDITEHCRSFIRSRYLNKNYDSSIYWDYQGQCFCYDFELRIKSLKESNYKFWLYQKCTEFGYFKTTSPEIYPFVGTISEEFYYTTCSSLFGPEFNETKVEEGVNNTNMIYGGQKPNVSNVVFVNGDLDPWHHLSILEEYSSNVSVIVIPRTSHGRILRAESDDDEEALIEARTDIKILIKKWIGVED